MKKNVCLFVFLPYKSKKIAEKISSIYSMKNVLPLGLIRDPSGTSSGRAACIRSGRPPWVHQTGPPSLPWVPSVVGSVSVCLWGLPWVLFWCCSGAKNFLEGILIYACFKYSLLFFSFFGSFFLCFFSLPWGYADRIGPAGTDRRPPQAATGTTGTTGTTDHRQPGRDAETDRAAAPQFNQGRKAGNRSAVNQGPRRPDHTTPRRDRRPARPQIMQRVLASPQTLSPSDLAPWALCPQIRPPQGQNALYRYIPVPLRNRMK